MQRCHSVRLLGLLTLGALWACSEAPNPTGPADAPGVYSATEFTTTANGITVDQLANGVTLTITLATDGHTSGSLSVPAAGGDPVDLAGRWTRTGSNITFQHPLQTFLDVLTFDLTDTRLTAVGVVGPNLIRVTLSR